MRRGNQSFLRRLTLELLSLRHRRRWDAEIRLFAGEQEVGLCCTSSFEDAMTALLQRFHHEPPEHPVIIEYQDGVHGSARESVDDNAAPRDVRAPRSLEREALDQ